jgi:spore coat polysaccharide biosynthesis protein SpsF
MNIVTIIQARMGSSRLPGKILLPLSDKPLLLRMVERVKASRLAGKIIVATTREKSDDPVYGICISEKIPVFRGHPINLLDRHYKTALKYHPDVVVKIPSDCPMIDPAVIDKVIDHYISNQGKYDYVSNLHPATYPDGNDVEVMSMGALSRAWNEAYKPYELEHTTPYIWENPYKFRIGNVKWETDKDYSMSHRFTIDYIEDYIFIKTIYDELFPVKPMFTLSDILCLLESKPEVMEINEKYIGVNWYRNHLKELKTITPEQTRMT